MIIINITTGKDDQGKEFIEVDSKLFGEYLRFTVEKGDDEQSALRVSFRQIDGTFIPGPRIPLERVPGLPDPDQKVGKPGP